MTNIERLARTMYFDGRTNLSKKVEPGHYILEEYLEVHELKEI